MTSAAPTTDAGRRPVGLRICSFLVGAAVASTVLLLVAAQLLAGPFDSNPNGSIDLLAAVGFCSMICGGVGGVVLIDRHLARHEPVPSPVTTTIFLSTVLAVPVLLYIGALLVLMLALESYQF